MSGKLRGGFGILLLVTLCFALITGVSNLEHEKQVLIKFRSDARVSQIDSLANSLRLVKINTIEEVNVDVFEVASERSVNEIVQVCSNLAFVEYAEPTSEVRTFSMETTEPSPEPAMAVQAEVSEFKPGEVIIKFKTNISDVQINSTLSHVGITIVDRVNEIGVLKCSIQDQADVVRTVAECNADPDIEYAEPNYIYRASVIPNDPMYSSLYGMDMIQAPAAWDTQTGDRSIIVGVIDTGVDKGHEDLSANIWTNAGEIAGNGVDDDGNGFVDDINGWDFVNGDNNPFDDNDHGTHVSGTIGAEGNNGKGVAGVNWQVSIMGLKFLSASGSGSTDDAIDAIIYGVNNGAKVLSNSWGGGGRSQALEDAIKFARDNGVIFVAAAGNNSSNTDLVPNYPSNYEVDNVVSVASSTSSDGLSSFSNFGKTTVDLAAPGSFITSTVPGNIYRSFNGTSMATPHVSGACALVWAQFPGLTWQQVIIRVLGGVDRNANFAGKVRTGGRLNINKSLSTNPIIVTERLENTLDETGPYTVQADIVDDGSIQDAILTYQVMGQNAVTVNMTSSGADSYSGDIPGQALGSTITYFVKATDNDGNTVQDSPITFSIAEPPSGGCCGKPAIDIAMSNEGLQTGVNALANMSFFLIPIIAIKFGFRRRK